MNEIRQVKHLSAVIKSQKDTILAMKESIKTKQDVISTQNNYIQDLKATIILHTQMANEYKDLKEGYSNVKYMNRELLKLLQTIKEV